MTSAYQIEPFLRALVAADGSDLHLKPEVPPRVRVEGVLRPLQVEPLSALMTERMVLESMTPDALAAFDSHNEADYAIFVPGVGRFRANAFRARGQVGLVARRVSDSPLTLSELGMPAVVSELALEPRGLVLVTGPTGSGKTTTLAGMVDLVNDSKPVHILTIEDPIEILHEDKMASVSQRELRTDTADFGVALKAAMRQDPDVILIGEMRDAETVHAALSAAETGHFVMSTLHTTDAAETVNRIIDFFPPHEHKQTRAALAQVLRGIVCQRLIPAADGYGRVCVTEVLVNTNRIAEVVLDPDRTHEITDIMAESQFYGMQTFDQHLVQLVILGQVTVAGAMMASTNPHDLEIALRRAGVDPHLIDA